MIRLFYLPALLAISPAAFAQPQSVAVYFETGKAKLDAAAVHRIDSLARTLETSAATITLHGHCDARGADAYNMALSQRRIAAVKKQLLASGLAPGRIRKAVGFGERQPVSPNDTEEGRRLNRRVEIRVTDLSLEEEIEQVQADSTIVLRHINFYGGTHRFLPEAQAPLEELLGVMKRLPGLAIRIEGHICCEEGTGDGIDNETGLRNLSEARALAVKEYLITHGISPGRMETKGFGHAVPIHPYPEKTEEERSANRRVEIRVLRNEKVPPG